MKKREFLIIEVFASPPIKNATNKTNVCHIDETWSTDLLDLSDHDPKFFQS